MKILISGRHIEVGESLKAHIEGAIKTLADKSFGDILEVHVNISKDGFRFSSEVSFHVSRHFIVRAHAENEDAYKSFDLALHKTESKIHRYKKRLRTKNRHSAAEEKEMYIPANRYVIDNEAEDSGESDVPLVIAEMNSALPTISVSDAVMRMDLTDDNVIMFRNAASGQFNVVYRRQDGNIGWIDPAKCSAQ